MAIRGHQCYQRPSAATHYVSACDDQSIIGVRILTALPLRTQMSKPTEATEITAPTTTQPPPNHHPITAQPRPNHGPTTTQPPPKPPHEPNHYPTTTRPPPDHHPTTTTRPPHQPSHHPTTTPPPHSPSHHQLSVHASYYPLTMATGSASWQAEMQRDAVIKAVYAYLFDWVIETVNSFITGSGGDRVEHVISPSWP